LFDRLTYWLLDGRPAKAASVAKGVNAFDFSPTANIIATGGSDKIVRVWNRGILSEPAARLVGHTFTVTDIVINDTDLHIVSLSAERVIRVWDIRTLSMLQVDYCWSLSVFYLFDKARYDIVFLLNASKERRRPNVLSLSVFVCLS